MHVVSIGVSSEVPLFTAATISVATTMPVMAVAMMIVDFFILALLVVSLRLSVASSASLPYGHMGLV